MFEANTPNKARKLINWCSQFEDVTITNNFVNIWKWMFVNCKKKFLLISVSRVHSINTWHFLYTFLLPIHIKITVFKTLCLEMWSQQLRKYLSKPNFSIKQDFLLPKALKMVFKKHLERHCWTSFKCHVLFEWSLIYMKTRMKVKQ